MQFLNVTEEARIAAEEEAMKVVEAETSHNNEEERLAEKARIAAEEEARCLAEQEEQMSEEAKIDVEEVS